MNPFLELEIKTEQQLLGTAMIQIMSDQHNLVGGYPESINTDGDRNTAIFALENGGRLELSLQIEEILEGEGISLLCSICNVGQKPVSWNDLLLPKISLNRAVFGEEAWTMQGAAVQWGQDYAFPLGVHTRENYLGHMQDGEGGGIPVVYFWNKSIGLALMHVEPEPKDWYMPVHCDSDSLTAALEDREALTLNPGESFTGVRSVIAICRGDFFEPLALYRACLAEHGIKAPEPVQADFEPAWCSWGYEFDIKPADMIRVLPVLKDLDIHWLTLDDRWFDAYGDWNPRFDTFPGGEVDMRDMNKRIHDAGVFSQIWWYPLCVEDGHGSWDSHTYAEAELFQKHSDWLIMDRDGNAARNNRHLAMLCPSVPEVQNHIRELTHRFIEDWGFDGHKLDNIYTVPACYNPNHHHQRPQESTEAMGVVYRIIFELTRALRPNSVTQICPCGTPLSMQMIPWTDQPVTADPTSSGQIRQRIKFYKALFGPKTAVSADHVELSDGSMDFASEIGVGGVPATKFIWPEDESLKARLNEYWNFPPEKQSAWKRWLAIYRQHRLAEGETLNLYDLAFDFPETHAIRKGKTIYYAFYQDHFEGTVRLKGLENRGYRAWDYVNHVELGMIDGSNPVLKIHFDQYLLLAATAD